MRLESTTYNATASAGARRLRCAQVLSSVTVLAAIFQRSPNSILNSQGFVP
jgi:hypothetical protein